MKNKKYVPGVSRFAQDLYDLVEREPNLAWLDLNYMKYDQPVQRWRILSTYLIKYEHWRRLIIGGFALAALGLALAVAIPLSRVWPWWFAGVIPAALALLVLNKKVLREFDLIWRKLVRGWLNYHWNTAQFDDDVEAICEMLGITFENLHPPLESIRKLLVRRPDEECPRTAVPPHVKRGCDRHLRELARHLEEERDKVMKEQILESLLGRIEICKRFKAIPPDATSDRYRDQYLHGNTSTV